MVFTGGQRPIERGQEADNESGIFTNTFGGLNTTASDLNCPFEDSPFLINCDITVSGKVAKRKGTKILRRDVRSAGTAVNNLGYTLLPFTTGLKYNYIVEKFRTDFSLYEVDNDVVTALITKTNVWNDAGADVRANYVTTSEIEPRIIFTTGINQPVQVKFVEQQAIADMVGTTIDFPDSLGRLVNVSTSNVIVYLNRTRVSGFGISYAANTLTVNTLPTLAVGDVVDIVFVTWQHIVDALIFDGDRFSQQTTRFNTVATDQNIAIPDRLRDDVVAEVGITGGEFFYNTRAYKSTVHNDFFDLVTDREPTTSDEYAFGDGGRYVPAAGNKVNPSPLFFTFGILDASGNPIALVIQRRRLLTKLNGGVGVVGTSLKVFVDGTEQTQSLKGFITPPALPSDAPNAVAYGDYFLFDSSWTVLTGASDVGSVISFEAADNVGVPFQSQIEIINATTTNIGTNANANVAAYEDGACQPSYGLGEFADYNAGSYPGNVAIYQGRLVFSGMPANPLQVLFSEVEDTVKPGSLYASFQIDQFATSATSPITLTLASTPDDFVTGLVPWQQSLFVFTRKAAFRLTGGDNVFTNTNNFTTRISQNGLVSSYGVAVTDRSILYLSDIGVFDLFLGIESDEFTASEKSLKIRDRFGITRNQIKADLSWLSYDANSRRVFVGLPEESTEFTSYRLYVFNVFRESWTEYETPGGFNLFYADSFIDETLGSGFLALGSLYKTNDTEAPSDRIFLKFDSSKYIDYLTSYVGAGVGTDYLVAPKRNLTVTTSDEVHQYGTDPDDYIGVSSTTKWKGFRVLPYTNLQDLDIRLETGVATGVFDTLVFGTDYVKQPNGDIYLIENPGTGRLMHMRQRLPVTDSEFGQVKYSVTSSQNVTENIIVFVDNVLRLSTALTLSEATASQVTSHNVNLNEAVDAVIQVGQAYQAVYTTPLLTLQTLANLKRLKHVYLYFDNIDGQPIYTAQDVNTSSGQSNEEIVGLPKLDLNASVIVLYESDLNGEKSLDLYGFSSLVWDDSLFDVVPSNNQYRRYTLFKEYLLGTGYSYQVGVWSFDETAFILSGWQVTSLINAERYINWSG